jgi:hypothetical protein
MGRKPNQLVTQHFDRGPKLANASNRYEYTCRSCRTHFPKGRLDSLIKHITDECHAPSPEERHVVAQQIPLRNAQQHWDKRSSHGLSLHETPRKQTSSLSNLEVLAEASRQVEYPGEGLWEENVDPSLREIETKVFDYLSHDQNGHGMLLLYSQTTHYDAFAFHLRTVLEVLYGNPTVISKLLLHLPTLLGNL